MIRHLILAATLTMLAPAAQAQPPAAASLEEQVLAGLNEVRTNPAGYAATLIRRKTGTA